MDKLDKYDRIVRELLEEYHQSTSTTNDIGQIETQIVFDRERHHYLLIDVGWHQSKRVFGVIIAIDIKAGKIWLQYNGTEESIAEMLVAKGVPTEDIVLGFHSEFKRQFTAYAVN
jgi:hypothetical protein